MQSQKTRSREMSYNYFRHKINRQDEFNRQDEINRQDKIVVKKSITINHKFWRYKCFIYLFID
jgi:hypothetical protein